MMVLLTKRNFGRDDGFENWIPIWVMMFFIGKRIYNDLKPVSNYSPKYPKHSYTFGLKTRGPT